MTDSAGEPRYRLGVLFVHGIGAQKRGPLHRTLQLTPEDPGDATEWLLAEAWWAEEFRPPSYRELVKWALAIGPWVIQRHLTYALVRESTFADALRDEQRRWRTGATTLIPPVESLVVLLKPAAALAAYVAVPLRQLLAFATALALGIVGQFLVALVLVFGIVPVLRRAVLRLQRAASESLGDCFALAMQPDVRVVRERPADDVDLLLTYGAGIAKLTALRRVPVGRAGLWSLLRFAAVALWALAAVVAGQEAAVTAGHVCVVLSARRIVRQRAAPAR